MKDVLRYVRDQYREPQNGLIKIILTQLFIFVLLLVVRGLASFFGQLALFQVVIQKLVFYPTWEVLRGQPWSIFTFTLLPPFAANGGIAVLPFLNFIFRCLNFYFWAVLFVDFFNNKRFWELYVGSSLVGALGLFVLSFWVDLGGRVHLAGHLLPMYGCIGAVMIVMPKRPLFFFFTGFRVVHLGCLLLAFLAYKLVVKGDVEAIAMLGTWLFGVMYVLCIQRRGRGLFGVSYGNHFAGASVVGLKSAAVLVESAPWK